MQYRSQKSPYYLPHLGSYFIHSIGLIFLLFYNQRYEKDQWEWDAPFLNRRDYYLIFFI